MRLEKFEIMKRIKHIADQTNEGCVNADLENLLSILKEADHTEVEFIPKCYEGHKLRSHVLVDRGDFKALVHWTEARDNLKGLESEAV